MPYPLRRSGRQQRKSQPRTNQTLQKPNGIIGPRVQKVGGERFAIVCVDPAKHRSEWMMADYFGNLLLEPRTLEHRAANFKLAIELIRQAQTENGIQDTLVVIERTGNYYLPPKRAFAGAGFETRIVHPFATKQYRMPADPGNKTDQTDLYAQHRAAVAGFGLCDLELESPYSELQLRARHRRSLVEKASALACQILEHLHLSMPGYAILFDRLFDSPALFLAARCESPAKMVKLGREALSRHLAKNKIRYQLRTIDKALTWAKEAVTESQSTADRCITPSGPTCMTSISVFAAKSRLSKLRWPAIWCRLRTFACWRFLASMLFPLLSSPQKWGRSRNTPMPTPSPAVLASILHATKATKPIAMTAPSFARRTAVCGAC